MNCVSILLKIGGWLHKALQRIGIITLISIAVYLCGDNFFFEFNHRPKEYIVSVFNQVHLNDSCDSIITTLSKDSPSQVTIDIYSLNTIFIVLRTPTQLNEKNWVLYLEMDKGVLIGKYIRYLDSRNAKRINAPDDVVLNRIHDELLPQYIY